MPLEDRTLGHYRLQQLIGSGGMGEIYLAEDLHIPRNVAVKVLRADYNKSDTSQEAERLFQREMKAISALDHPHILPVFDYGTEQIGTSTLTYLVMPYRPEGSLVNWLRQRGDERLTPQEVAHILREAADALQHAHDRHIVHQDIKPPNFLIRARTGITDLPDILLADFGIAKIITATSSASQSVRGTPFYMSPEQWEARPVPASDQYSLAVMAFQLLTGQPPFQGGPSQVMYKHFHEQPARPSALNPRLSETLDPVLLRALAKRPEMRFPSVLQFAQAFEQALAPETATLVRSPMQAPQIITQTRFVPQPQSQPGGPLMPTPIPPVSNPQSAVIGNSQPGTNLQFPQPVPSQTPTLLRPPENRPAPTVTPPVLPLQPLQPEKAPARSAFLPRLLVIGLIALVVLASGGFLLARVIGWPPGSAKPAPTGKVDSAATQQARQIDASATAMTRANATQTAIANDPYLSGKGTLLLNDSLSKANHWRTGTSGSWGGTCFFKNGTYHIEQSIGPDRMDTCDAGSLQASNFIYEVQVNILQGTCGGMRFRYDKTAHTGYDFGVCTDGTALLQVVPPGGGITTLFKGTSAALKTGLNQSNTIAVVADGKRISLYINKHKITEITDGIFSKGMFALFANDHNLPTEVAFSHAKIWKL